MGNAEAKMQDQLFNLRMSVKQLERQSKKSTRQEREEKQKVKKAMSEGNYDIARIHAQNAVRKRTESSNFLQLACRLDAVAGRVDTAVRMNQVTGSMKGIVGNMSAVLKNMDVEEISDVMGRFEKQFEDLDVSSEVMAGAMTSATALSTPEDQVNSLMSEVADEYGIEFKADAPVISSSQIAASASAEQQQQAEASNLSARLAALRSLNPQ